MKPSKNEIKYQLIKLYHSRKISLKELKALFRVVAGVAEDEYMSSETQREVLKTRDRIQRIRDLGITRNQAKILAEMRFKTKKRLVSTKQEHIAELVTFWGLPVPHDWSRFSSLIRKGKPNPPRPGSSKGKIGRSKFIGFKKVNRALDGLFNAIASLIEQDKIGKKKIRRLLNNAKPSITVSRNQ